MAEGGVSIARSQESIDDPDSTSQASQHVLQRMKSDRSGTSKGEEDRRRRTIIVEKKNGTYGFTLQSYGIHYKKDQNVDKFTYVDYVEYGGPAHRSGMREGDVILSINGSDMDKSDHKTIVAFINSCDTRMRMVVTFEDVVRKVELHMRYIQLQNVLQMKMNELERTCLKERELLDGKWKTHSLPAPRKKTTTATASSAGATTTPSDENLAAITPDSDVFNVTTMRPISTEDVHLIRAQRHHVQVIPPPTQFMLTYQYLDPRCRYILKPATSANGSGEYLLSIAPPPRSKSEHQQFYVAGNSNVADAKPSMPQKSSSRGHERSKRDGEMKKSSKSRHCHGHSCNPCIGHKKDKQNNGDNVSLDAYDLANPCCAPQCMPNSDRRRSKHKHKHRDKDSKEHRPRSQSHANAATTTAHCSQTDESHTHSQSSGKHHQSHRRLYDLSNQLASRCSLHSCISSSEFDNGAADNSMASYTTSLSTDTLYWDPHSDASISSNHQHSTKSHQSLTNHMHQPQRNSVAGVIVVPTTKQMQPRHHHNNHHHQRRYHQVHSTTNTPAVKSKHTEIVYGGQAQAHMQYIQQKPKSWDNLATNSMGGYGYLDTAVAPHSQSNLVNANTRYVISGTQTVGHSTHAASRHRRPTASASIDTLSMPGGGHQRHSIPRKNALGRYSTLDIENYAPPPSQFVARTTTKTVTKSTENLLGNAVPYNVSDSSINSACDCNLIDAQNKLLRQHSQPNDCLGYYSHLPQTIVCTNTTTGNGAIPKQTNGTNAKNTTGNSNVAAISEITRL